jgi:exportin-T
VNRAQFEAVLDSIVQYAMDTSDAAIEKLAFSVLNKMVVVWTPPFDQLAVAEDISPSGFDEAFGQFVTEHLLPVCFEVPRKPELDFADAQSRLVSSW